MKSTWSKTTSKAVEVAKAITGPIVRAVTGQVAHKCDPSGWSCDCARRAFVNSSTDKQGGRWIQKRKGWLR